VNQGLHVLQIQMQFIATSYHVGQLTAVALCLHVILSGNHFINKPGHHQQKFLSMECSTGNMLVLVKKSTTSGQTCLKGTIMKGHEALKRVNYKRALIRTMGREKAKPWKKLFLYLYGVIGRFPLPT
jgi:hypothetical protein